MRLWEGGREREKGASAFRFPCSSGAGYLPRKRFGRGKAQILEAPFVRGAGAWSLRGFGVVYA